METNRPTFDEFLARWRTAQIVALGTAGVDPADRRHVARTRAHELQVLALQGGYRSELAQAVKPYRTVISFVEALYESAEHELKAAASAPKP
jgi:hypothetical protein